MKDRPIEAVDFFDDPDEVSPETTKTLVDIAKEYGIKKDRIKLLDFQLTKLKAETQEQETILYDLFEAAKLSSIKSGNRTYFTRIDTYASVDTANTETALQWVRDAGYEDIIKLGVNARTLTSAIKDFVESTGETPGEDDGIKLRTVNRVGVRGQNV
jgi:hypothetical protein